MRHEAQQLLSLNQLNYSSDTTTAQDLAARSPQMD
jgi:hypothetical protein